MNSTAGFTRVNSDPTEAGKRKNDHPTSDSDDSDLSEEVIDSEQSHNISTISSSNQIQQPRFLQQIGFISPTHPTRKQKQSRIDGEDPSDSTSKIIISGLGENFDIRKGDKKETQASHPLISPRHKSRTGSNAIVAANVEEQSPSYYDSDGQYTGKLKGEDESYNLATPSRMNRSESPQKKSMYKQFSQIGWSQVANAFRLKSRLSTQQINKKASARDCEFIADKAHATGQKSSAETEAKSMKAGGAKKIRFKELLEKHSIIKRDVKSEFVKRLLRRMSHKKKTRKQLVMEALMRLRKRIIRAAVVLRYMFSNLLQPWRPQGKKRVIWDIISAICTLYEIIFIPFYLGFDFNQSQGLATFEIVKDFFFFCEVLLNFHTGYLSDGAIVLSHRRIAHNYIRHWFIVDLAANMPYVEIFILASKGAGSLLDNYDNTYIFYKLVRLLRVIKFYKITKIFSRFQHKIQSQIVSGLLSLATLLIYIIFMAHYVACIWHFVGRSDESGSNSWIIQFGFHDTSIKERYIASLYWAITTMLTVGYGDITPVNSTERLVNILSMLAGCCMFAYSMNSIGILLQNINQEVTKKQQKYHLISKYLKRKNVPKQTQKKVEKYLDYLFESNSEKIGEEEGALKLLSETLQQEVQNEINGSALRENQLFITLFGNKFLAILSRNLEERIFSPGEIIFDETDTEFAIYFISAGTIQLYLSNSSSSLAKLEKDNHFGEIAFFSDKPRTAAARSLTFASAFLLKKSTFLTILEKNEPEKEVYNEIKDKINLNQDYTPIKLQCYVCDKKGHYGRICPNIHYNLNTEEVIKKFLKEDRAFYANFLRPPRTKFRALSQMKEVQQNAAEFYEINIQLIKELLSAQQPSLSSVAWKQRISTHTASEFRSPVHGKRESEFRSPLNAMNGKRESEYRYSVYGRRESKVQSHIQIETQRKKNRQSTFRGRRNSDQQYEKQHGKGESDDYVETQHDIYKGYETMRTKRDRKTEKEIDEEEDETILEDDKEVMDYHDDGYAKNHVRYSRAAPLPLEFDAVKNYSFYFAHNNIVNIIDEIKKQIQEKDRLKKIQMHIEGVKNKVEKIKFPMTRRTSLFTPSNVQGKRRRTNASFFPNNEV